MSRIFIKELLQVRQQNQENVKNDSFKKIEPDNGRNIVPKNGALKTNKPPALDMRVVGIALALCKKPPVI